MKIGDSNVIVNGRTTKLEIAPSVIDGSTFVPLRFVGETSGGDVTWSAKNRSVGVFFDKDLNLKDAAFNNDSERLERLIQSGVNVNAKDKDGRTPLMNAVLGKSVESVKRLITLGAKVNESNNDGWTALFIASLNFDNETVKILLQNGADPKIATKDGGTPLSIASADVNQGSSGHPEVQACKPNVTS